MFSKVILLIASSLVMVCCEPPVPQYGVPFNNGGGYNNFNGGGNGVNGGIPSDTYGPADFNNGGGHGGNGHDDHGGEPKSYEFGYQVKDDYTGTNYNRQEQSDGNQVTGSYRVALPDGRIQIVTYVADWKTGFHADVRYEGEAQYPEVYNNGGGNGYGSGPSNQYGPPVNPIAVNNQYAPPSSSYGAPNGGGYPSNGGNGGYSNNGGYTY